MVWIRVMVVCWKDEQFAPPSSVGDFLTYTSSAQLMTSPHNRVALQNREWLPMYDRTFQLKHPESTVPGGPSTQKHMNLKFFGKRLPMKRMTFNAGNTPDHRYYLLVMSNLTGVTEGSVTTFISRITYTDV